MQRGLGLMQGESPGLSCCCTFPPREILTFPAHTHSPFWRKPSGRVKQKRARVEKVGPLAFCLSPPPSPSSSSVNPSAHCCWWWWRRWGMGTYSAGTRDLAGVKGARQHEQSHPVTLLLSMQETPHTIRQL